MTFRRGYALATVLIFAIEVAIALYVHDAIVRPYIGDSLAVILVYTALRAVTPLRVTAAMLTALSIAFAIEFGQLFGILDLLHLRGFAVARIVLGSSYETADLFAYAAGAAVALILERLRG